jgi:hypothetical protein
MDPLLRPKLKVDCGVQQYQYVFETYGPMYIESIQIVSTQFFPSRNAQDCFHILCNWELLAIAELRGSWSRCMTWLELWGLIKVCFKGVDFDFVGLCSEVRLRLFDTNQAK